MKIDVSLHGALTLYQMTKYSMVPDEKHLERQINPLPDDKILDWSKLKQIADNILKCI